ncbi:hypothetical protein MVEN_01980400 [Mycena venus]|uniref:Uncharacterized protein n=1 Tax=Mycena venus TaxID=2733690 RepID=A0A8H7CK81_9AGAR|nr:hypothetical protein MVEN_01980400 [Mycena venus]
MTAASTTASSAEPSCSTVPARCSLLGHYRIGKKLHTVYKGSRDIVLNTPASNDAPMPEPWDRNPDFRTPTYISPRYPYLAFIPKHNPWHGVLLGILDYTFQTLPIDAQEDGSWSLNREVVQEWHDFELCLRDVGQNLLWISTKRWPRELAAWFVPFRYKYNKFYKTEKVGSKRSRAFDSSEPTAKRARTEREGERPDRSDERRLHWRERLLEKIDVHPSWLDILQMTVATDWMVPRIGGLIDLTREDPAHPSLEWLCFSIMNSGYPIPLYFSWGALPRQIDFDVPEYIKRLGLLPDRDELAYIAQLPDHVAFSPLMRDDRGFYSCRPPPSVKEPSSFSSPASPSPARAPPLPSTTKPASFSFDAEGNEDFPPVVRGSGQRDGERMEVYFARRQRENAKEIARESPAATHARKQREENAKRGQPPGAKGARVYVWEEENGFYVRRPAGRKKYVSYFEDHPPSERRYDSVSDEWDLCSAFEEDGPSHGDDDDDEGYPPIGFDDADMPGIEAELVAVDVGAASERDVRRNYLQFGPGVPQQEGDEGAPPYVQIAGDLPLALYMRFGFTMGEPRKSPARKPEQSIVASLVGLQDIIMEFKDVMATFLGQYLEAQSPNDIDQELLDFHQRDHSALFKAWPFAVRREILTNTRENSKAVYYVLSDHASALGSEVLLLQRAVDVLEILRQGWGPHIKDVARRLLSRGMSFRIAIMESVELMRGHPAVAPRRRRRIVNVNSGLGYRKEQHRATVHDYRAYIAQLNSQLLHTSRGHVALPYGGIIGRLARLEVSDEQALRGPNEEVYDVGVCLWDGGSDHAYWYEDLTEHEIDLICGVYYVATGKKIEAGAEQTMLLSFWPKPNAWGKGNLDPGWWSGECEGWFQKRLRRLEEGKTFDERGILCRPSEWKHNLRFVKALKDYVQAHERVSAAILVELCAQ